VGDVLQLQRRPVVVDPKAEYEEIGVRSFGKGIFHKDPVSGVELGNKRVFRIQPGDLVLSNVFAWEGAVAVAGLSESGKIGSHRFMTFTPIDNQIDTTWAAWFFRSESGLELIGRASPGSAGRNRTLAIDRFENLVIPLPSLGEQRQVAARLSTISATTAALHQQIADTSRISAALVATTTDRSDRNPDEKLQSGWRRVQLAELMDDLPPDVVVEPSVSYSIAGLFSFGRGLINRGRIVGADTSYRTLRSLAEGDVVVSKLNGWEGAVAVVPKPFAGYCVSSEYPVFRPNPELLIPGFFSGIARSPWFWESLNRSARGSMVRRRRITGNDLLDTEIWVPPIASQVEIADRLVTIDRVADLRNQARTRLDALVPAALNAEFGNLN
jgi:type I restriction enzyme S subunit